MHHPPPEAEVQRGCQEANDPPLEVIEVTILMPHRRPEALEVEGILHNNILQTENKVPSKDWVPKSQLGTKQKKDPIPNLSEEKDIPSGGEEDVEVPQKVLKERLNHRLPMK